MNPLLTHCPVCSDQLTVAKLQCGRCHTTIEGHFTTGPLAHLTPEQQTFLETFVRCEGKISHVERAMGISYTAVRGKLEALILALGYAPGVPPTPPISPVELAERRRDILAQVERGEISATDAVDLLRHE